MKTSKRILLFAIGAFIGVMLVIVLFSDKDIFGFLPNNRVLEDIQNSTLMITEDQKAKLECLDMDDTEIFEMIENADVDFSNSVTSFVKETVIIKGKEKIINVKKYLLEYKGITLSFWICLDESLSIINVVTQNSNCEIADNLDKTKLQALFMPEDLVFSKMNKLELRLNKEIQCEMKCLGITKDELKQVFVDGKILFNESFPERRPNPIYFITKKIKGADWAFWVEIGATKTRVKHVLNISGLELTKDRFLLNEMFTNIKAYNKCECGE